MKTAFILGAGLGLRLRPLTSDCPKPLLPLGGRPMITFAMDHLLTAGVQRFIINTHHRAEVYGQTFPEKRWRGVPIVFRHEPILLDTAGGLKNIEDLLAGDRDILVYNGDVVSDLPLAHLIRAHARAGTEVTLALRSKGGPLQISLNDRNEVCDIRAQLGREGQKYLFTGIYAVKTTFLRRLEPGRPESVIDVFLRMIQEQAGPIAGVVIDEGTWQDAGSPEEYERLNGLFVDGKDGKP